MPMSTITASVDSRNKQNNYFSTQLSRAQAPQALYITKPLCQKISFLRAIYTGSRTANSHVIKMRRFFCVQHIYLINKIYPHIKALKNYLVSTFCPSIKLHEMLKDDLQLFYMISAH